MTPTKIRQIRPVNLNPPTKPVNPLALRARERHCEWIAQQLCVELHIDPQARGVAILLNRVNFKTNLDAIGDWLVEREPKPESASHADDTTQLHCELQKVLAARAPSFDSVF